MKKMLTLFCAMGLATASVPLMSVSAANLIQSDFESSLDSWSGRGSASVALSSTAAQSGSQSAAVTGRTETWNGISHDLGSSFSAGKTYSFSAMVMHNSSSTVHFKFSLQYSSGMGTSYDSIVEADVSAGKWTKLENTSFTIPSGASSMSVYIETEDSTCDFFVDDIVITDGTGSSTPSGGGNTKGNGIKGDVNLSGKTDNSDASALQSYLLGKNATINLENADMDGNGKLNAIDLSLLKTYILNPPAEPDEPETGNHATPTEYMSKVRAAMTQNVPSNVQQGDGGKTSHISYFSKKANKNKGAYVWLPPNYDANKKYPVLYMNHGIMGDESSMLNGFAVREMATNLIKSGDAEPMIIVFTMMYTNPAKDNCSGITAQETPYYDDFLYDLTESLMPYIESNYPVKTGRENTAIAGFSMGGRESLYITISRPDLFGYMAASSPAPGVVPGVDMFMTHPGNMSESEFKIPSDKLPYLVMIGGGTNDGVVGTFPEQYHNLFTKNGTDHIWMSVAGGGHDGSVGIPLFYNFFKAVFKA